MVQRIFIHQRSIVMFLSKKKKKSYVVDYRITPGVTLRNVTSLIIFQLNASLDESVIRLYYLPIFSIIARFRGDQRSIVISSINYLNLSFYSLKQCTHNFAKIR